jgi:large subunit ribosomal protein L13
VVEHAIKGMLPKNRLGREVFRNLHIYAGDQHPHEAQMPKIIELQK